MREFAKILRFAANNVLADEMLRYDGIMQEFSCLALMDSALPFDWFTRRSCQAWYSQQFDMPIDLVSDHIERECGKESQNVRFMFMLFAAHLAEEEFAEK